MMSLGALVGISGVHVKIMGSIFKDSKIQRFKDSKIQRFKSGSHNDRHTR